MSTTEVAAFEPLVFRNQKEEAEPLSALQEEILQLKEERNAILLAHNYQIAVSYTHLTLPTNREV